MISHIDSLCKQISHGVYVVTVSDGDRRNAFTAAWVMQVSFNPLMLAFSINPEHRSYEILRAGGICAVNVLGKHQLALAAHFGRSSIDKMAGFQWQSSETGALILLEALAYFDCKVSHFTDAGDHKIAVCEVLAAAQLNPGEVLLYQETDDMDGSQALFSKAKE